MNVLRLPGDITHIVVCDPDDPTARFAAEELRRYICRVSRARLKLSGDRGRPRPSRAFLLRIAGRTEDDGFDLRIDPQRKAIHITGANPRSLLFGVYRWLQRFLGVRWPAPGRAGEVYTPVSQVQIPALRARERPLLKFRGFYVDTAQLSVTRENIADIVDWMTKNCGNYLLVSVAHFEALKDTLVPAITLRGLTLEVGHHGFFRFVDPARHFRRHPEWFSLVNGRRARGIFASNMVHDSQLCGANREALDRYADGIRRLLDDNPAISVFGIVPNDGFGWCECPQCLKHETITEPAPLRDPGEDERNLRVSSGRFHHIVREVARRLHNAYPDRRFSFPAYGGTILPSPGVRDLPDNFMVMIALYERWYDQPLHDRSGRYATGHMNPRIVEILDRWRDQFPGERYIYEYYSKYAWMSMPKWMPDIICKDMRYLARTGTRGLLSMIEPEGFPLYEPNHMAQLAMSWSRSMTSQAWLDDYARILFPVMEDAVGNAIRGVIDLMGPFAMLGPPYPRGRTPAAIQRARELARHFSSLTAEARRAKLQPPASRRRLALWSKNLNLAGRRFALNALYHDMIEAVAQGRYEDALAVLRRWERAKTQLRRHFERLWGTRAVITDRARFGKRPGDLLKEERRLRHTLQRAASGRHGEDPLRILRSGSFRLYAA